MEDFEWDTELYTDTQNQAISDFVKKYFYELQKEACKEIYKAAREY